MKLTTHVLDTASGMPGAGIKVELYQLGDERSLLASTFTNSDGRTDAPLLAGEGLQGEYELLFYVGEYFDRCGYATPSPKFLDCVPLRFGVSADTHYHVPLLVSPWSYSTYRGS